MSGFIEGLGLIAGALGVISFGLGNAPSGSGPQGAAVQIKAGLGDDVSNEMGGTVDRVDGFDINNDYLGVSNRDVAIDRGSIGEFEIDQGPGSGVQTSYLNVVMTDQATCISWISVKQVDGTTASWTGDVGNQCGQNWYYGNQIAGKIPKESGGGDYTPLCTWLDADGTNDIRSASMKVNLPAYGEKVKDNANQDAACANTIFSKDTSPISDKPGAKRRARRSQLQARHPALEKRLIVASNPSHNATELCAHPNSYGPDMIGSDGVYCDMAAKRSAPLCSVQNVDGCVDLDGDLKSITRRNLGSEKRDVLNTRSYNSIHYW